MAYLLQRGDLLPSKQDYSYSQRAQSVTYLTQWQQLFMCEEAQPLIDWVIENVKPSYYSDYRIEGIGKHAAEGTTAITSPPQT